MDTLDMTSSKVELEERAIRSGAALPPQPDEDIIDGPRDRVEWLARVYFERPKVFVRDPYETREYVLLSDPAGWLWKLIIPLQNSDDFVPPYIERAKNYVIGSDNTEIKQPIT